MIVLCLMLAVAAFLLSAPLTWVLIGLSHRRGLVDAPDLTGGRKNHARPTPNTGGIAIFSAITIPIALLMAAIWLVPQNTWTGPMAAVAPHIEGLRSQTPMAVGVLAALLAVHVLGLIDDRKRLGPYSKLIVQLLIALGLVLFCQLRILEFLGRRYGMPGELVSVVLSVLWIVVIVNALNFLDNMDGLTAGIGAICAALYLAATLIGGQWFVAGTAALLAGALVGFLVFNFPPAKIFMGDGGSLVVGLLLAIVSIRTTYFAADATHMPGAWYGVLMPLMVLAIPLYDFTSVTLIRLAQGKSPFQGDQNHFSHRLVRRGLSKRAAVITIWLCTLATGLGGVILGSLDGWKAAVVAGQSAGVIVLLAILERSGLRDP
ncbi:MAG: undecaprenyl/decaprenyl-phosphate alpha-N-acetylglucosaminyl 1-phosphate transferase [Phycisphaeraceae bacterium]|nr:undecaprenyl/decaprenyl-phosphate alpha-N-acetylglucosaminyl 1-phosphate transferase [Phycisphaeraceae bacterium]